MADAPSHARRDQVIAWSFVAIQAGFLLAIVALPRNTDWQPTALARMVAGIVFFGGIALDAWAFLYLGRGLTPSPLPNSASKLVTRGPYAFVRHPIYTGVIILSIGIAIRSGNSLVVGATVALTVLFMAKARWEEAHLLATFPGYADYRQRTGRFLPHVRLPSS